MELGREIIASIDLSVREAENLFEELHNDSDHNEDDDSNDRSSYYMIDTLL